jgi:phosphatidylinositol glycan class N
LSGGALMVLIGVLYLIFERQLLAKSGFQGDSTERANNGLSRALIGVQVSRVVKTVENFT